MEKHSYFCFVRYLPQELTLAFKSSVSWPFSYLLNLHKPLDRLNATIHILIQHSTALQYPNPVNLNNVFSWQKALDLEL